MAAPLHFDFQSLRIFVVVAETGSLTRAATETCLTLSAVSKRMADLERSIDCILFSRQPRGVVLTAAGQALLVHAREVVDRVGRMATDISDFAVGVRGHVRVWANTSAVIQFLPQDIRGFLDRNPGIKISIEERLSDEIVAAIGSGQADLGIFADNVLAPDVDKQVYRRDKLILLVPQAHPLADVEQIAFADTLDFDYVGLNQGSSLLARLQDAAHAADRVLKLRIQVSSFDGICRMIEQGLGIGVLPERAIRRDIPSSGLHAIRLLDEWADRTLCMGTRAGGALSPETERLLAFMGEHATVPAADD